MLRSFAYPIREWSCLDRDGSYTWWVGVVAFALGTYVIVYVILQTISTTNEECELGL